MKHRNHISLAFTAAWILFFVLVLDSYGQLIGDCQSPTSIAYLETNNVRAQIQNKGGLFNYEGYEVPRFSGLYSSFSASLWVAGNVDGIVRIVATRYGPWEFWSGPLDDSGSAPTDCSVYDRLYSVSKSDVAAYESTGEMTGDMVDWPTGLGAPTRDGNGNPVDVMHTPFLQRRNRVVDLDAGERPDFDGDQIVWWIMNDMGNTHDTNKSPPVDIEVHGSAYAFSSTQTAVNNSTMYRYRLFYRGASRLDSAYVGFWLDADIGSEQDDYMGSDSLLGLAYMYNADSLDFRYGLAPPAMGVILLEGPLTDRDGLDNNRNGIADEIGERAHIAHIIDETDDIYDARTAETRYNRLKGRWPWGQRMTAGGRGCCESGTPVNYIYPGDPVKGEYWSMINRDSTGISSYTKMQVFLASVGPMALEPESEIDLTFAIVWARGKDNLDSITELRKAVVELREAYIDGFANLPRGNAPSDTLTLLAPADGIVSQPTDPILYWTSDGAADAYEIQIWSPDTTITDQSLFPFIQFDELGESSQYSWRVRSLNTFGVSPWSDAWTFNTGYTSFQGLFPIISAFEVVQNAAGVLDPPDMAAFSFTRSGFPPVPCPTDLQKQCDRPTRGYQQSTNDSAWGIHAGGGIRSYGQISDSLSFLGRVTRMGDNLEAIGSDDYEIRFGDTPGKALLQGTTNEIEVPFEIWNIGESTPNDPSDDFRMIPFVCESECEAGTNDGVFDIGGDHSISGGTNDPYTDHFSWYNPVDQSAGVGGYDEFFGGSIDIGAEVYSHMVLVGWNGGREPPYEFPLPEPGTVFRISSTHDPAPILAAPGSNQELLGGMVRFFWQGAGHDSYRLQVSASQSFDYQILDSLVLVQNLDVSMESVGTYFWRVRSIRSPWSEIGTFRVVQAPSPEPPVEPPVAFSISAYPNPVRGIATMAFGLPAKSHVRIEIYDLLGRRILDFVNEEIEAGMYHVPLDVSRLSSGLYFYAMSVENIRLTGKIVIVN